MRCTAIQQRLVAFQDDELSPGECVRVREHLADCETCRHQDDHLGRLGPMTLNIPTHAMQAMHDATDPDRIWQLAQSRPAPSRWQIDMQWLRREIEVPTWWLLVAAAMLATTVGWAVGASASLDDRQAELAARAPSPVASIVGPSTELPAEQFRAASWRASDDPVYH